LILPKASPVVNHVYHQYVIRTSRRDALRTYLLEKGIGTLVHYPVPIHRQPAYAGRFRERRPLPRTEEIAGQVLSLPIYPELNADQVRTVGREIQAWCRV
jgi:dTDP-4-amino-4,6-dideoxygalactose transaminase